MGSLTSTSPSKESANKSRWSGEVCLGCEEAKLAAFVLERLTTVQLIDHQLAYLGHIPCSEREHDVSRLD